MAGWAHTDADEYLRNLFTPWERLGEHDPAGFGRSVTMTGFSRGFLNGVGREGVEALIPNNAAHAGHPAARRPRPGRGRPGAAAQDHRADAGGRPPHPDATVRVENGRELAAAIGGSAYAEIDAGHVVFFEEEEEEFVRTVTGFLAA